MVEAFASLDDMIHAATIMNGTKVTLVLISSIVYMRSINACAAARDAVVPPLNHPCTWHGLLGPAVVPAGAEGAREAGRGSRQGPSPSRRGSPRRRQGLPCIGQWVHLMTRCSWLSWLMW